VAQWLADKAYALGRWLDRRTATPESNSAPRVVVSASAPATTQSVGSQRILGMTSTFSPVTSSVFGAPQLPRPIAASALSTHVFHQWPSQGVKTSSTVNQYP